ncbi:MAG: hypothetical protein EAZ57_02110 [Cytophagales bacterium]|nr:MAG: hypothetical protein EAZ67_02475 [Cytophagales bacterium]TAF61916.1 MAG: hypothetical protein EAZ57_02110 [Cytophagales bacterium]
MPNKLYLWLSAVLSALAINAQAQGCSDAGFCTMGAMRPNQNLQRSLKVKLRSLELTQYRGDTGFGVVVNTTILDASISIGSRNSVQIKLPYNYVQGRLTNTQGTGDISLAYTRNLIANDRYQLNATLGTKIPTTNANQTFEGKPLPMYYQSSLGTHDLIAGFGFNTKNWTFSTGIQKPLDNIKNEFLWKPWNKTADSAIAASYPRSNQLRRGTDLMLRAERNWRYANINFFGGLLGIYRLNEDVFMVKNAEGKLVEKTEPGTSGLVLTGLVGVGYQFSARSGLRFLGGYRLLKRKSDKNTDGLSRLYVLNLTYAYRF